MVDELENLIRESYQELPFRVNQKRFAMDLIQVPRLIFQDARVFIQNCASAGSNFLAELYGTEYKSTDFKVFKQDLPNEKNMVCILLPALEDFSSLDYCSAFVVAYSQTNGVIADMELYAIVESNYGWRRIVKYDSGDHSEYVCRAEEKLTDNIHLISALIK